MRYVTEGGCDSALSRAPLRRSQRYRHTEFMGQISIVQFQRHEGLDLQFEWAHTPSGIIAFGIAVSASLAYLAHFSKDENIDGRDLGNPAVDDNAVAAL